MTLPNTRFATLLAFVLLSLVFGGLLPAPAAAGFQRTVLAGKSVVYWQPPGPDSGKHPLVLFSHGHHGCATQSKFLMEALAAHGYWVFAPNHQDASCDRRRFQASTKRSALSASASVPSFRDPGSWNAASYQDRGEDFRKLLAALRQDSRFQARIDFSNIALVGHSLGGYTALGLAGAWPTWRLPNVKAVLALSPYSLPFNGHGALRALSAPVMYQGGTRDFAVTPALRRPGGIYDQTGTPKYYVEFGGANHYAWTDLQGEAHPLINRYSTAFLDLYLKGDSKAAGILATLKPGVAQLLRQPSGAQRYSEKSP